MIKNIINPCMDFLGSTKKEINMYDKHVFVPLSYGVERNTNFLLAEVLSIKYENLFNLVKQKLF